MSGSPSRRAGFVSRSCAPPGGCARRQAPAFPHADRRTRDHRQARPADAERARRHRARQATRPPPASPRRSRGTASSSAPPIRPTGAPACSAPAARAKRSSSASARARTLTSRAASASSATKTSRLWSARRKCSSACSRIVRDGRAQANSRLLRGPELPQVVRRAARLDQRQLDADRRRDVACPDPYRLRAGRRRHLRASVPADPPGRRLGRPDRRLRAQAPPAHPHPGAHGDPARWSSSGYRSPTTSRPGW